MRRGAARAGEGDDRSAMSSPRPWASGSSRHLSVAHDWVPAAPADWVPRMWADKAATVSIRSLPSRPVSAPVTAQLP